MKKFTITASALLAVAMMFASCKKCETCTTTAEVDTSGIITSTSASVEYCGKELDNKPVEGTTSVSLGVVTTTTTIACAPS